MKRIIFLLAVLSVIAVAVAFVVFVVPVLPAGVQIACAVTGIFCAVQLLRPVSRAQKAYLVHLAEGDPEMQRIVDELVATKWLTWTKYDAAKSFLTRRKDRLETEAMLARSAARRVVSSAQRKS
ncbi:hypothetical protein [Ralstonia sp. ASV6]|uniref:hypothetical protein n=1 Tax=Ralstonia sp. ASV6 TaxID=2795124 RepID=UPI0018EAF156|nr:hypothetical protein [Ralstonia sp. ASV6]